MKALLLTSEKASNKDFVKEILEISSEVLIHYGEFSTEFIKENSISAILSDRNGYLIPDEIVNVLNGRVYNTHPSLLPLHRGWQPVFFSVLENSPIGVSIHQVNSGLDKGLLVAQEQVKVSLDDDLKTIHTKCRLTILKLLLENWPSMLRGTAPLLDQTGYGCYHKKTEFEYYFRNLKSGWSSTQAEVRTLRKTRDS